MAWETDWLWQSKLFWTENVALADFRRTDVRTSHGPSKQQSRQHSNKPQPP
jgi:hypothetical protein